MNIEEILVQMNERIDTLNERVATLEAVTPGVSATGEMLDHIDIAIRDAIENNDDVRSKCDLYTIRHLAGLLEVTYPDRRWFRFCSLKVDFEYIEHDDRGEPLPIERVKKRIITDEERPYLVKLGKRLRKLGYLRKVTPFYIPADHEEYTPAVRSSTSVWVIRNHEQYQNVGPAFLKSDAESQWFKACAEYNAQRETTFI